MTKRQCREPIPLDPTKGEVVVEAAIGWFAEHGRDLPWRRTRDPWAILVSEVMLQQLRVGRTLPFYERFLACFPTPAALAEASLGDALVVWGDLGRYRSAAALHRTARILVAEHGGGVPSDLEALRRLPGVGAYTAGAVACFAFERDAAFLDTNARRVLHRVFAGVDVPRPVASPTALAELAGRLVPAGRGWAWNQALIEVGALRCRARSVDCPSCPLRAWCRAAPTIQAALSDAKARPTTPARYADTNRQHRGQVLRALRESGEPTVGVEEIGRRIRPGFGEADRPWITGVVESLAKDGLIVRSPGTGRAIGEETAAYLAEPPGDVEGDELIGLP